MVVSRTTTKKSSVGRTENEACCSFLYIWEYVFLTRSKQIQFIYDIQVKFYVLLPRILLFDIKEKRDSESEMHLV